MIAEKSRPPCPRLANSAYRLRACGAERRGRVDAVRRILRQAQVFGHHRGGEARPIVAVGRRARHQARHRAIAGERPALARGLAATSNSLSAARPRRSARVNASQTPIIEIASIMLLQILAAWPLPEGPVCTMALPICSRIGRARATPSSAADHEGERRVLGAGDAARDRRVEHLEATLRGRLHDRARAVDVDGRAVDQQSVGLGAGDDALVAEIDLAHVAAFRQHGDHELGRGGGLGHRVGRPGACPRRGLERRRDHVEAAHRMARLGAGCAPWAGPCCRGR